MKRFPLKTETFLFRSVYQTSSSGIPPYRGVKFEISGSLPLCFSPSPTIREIPLFSEIFGNLLAFPPQVWL